MRFPWNSKLNIGFFTLLFLASCVDVNDIRCSGKFCSGGTKVAEANANKEIDKDIESSCNFTPVKSASRSEFDADGNEISQTVPQDQLIIRGPSSEVTMFYRHYLRYIDIAGSSKRSAAAVFGSQADVEYQIYRYHPKGVSVMIVDDRREKSRFIVINAPDGVLASKKFICVPEIGFSVDTDTAEIFAYIIQRAELNAKAKNTTVIGNANGGVLAAALAGFVAKNSLIYDSVRLVMFGAPGFFAPDAMNVLAKYKKLELHNVIYEEDVPVMREYGKAYGRNLLEPHILLQKDGKTKTIDPRLDDHKDDRAAVVLFTSTQSDVLKWSREENEKANDTSKGMSASKNSSQGAQPAHTPIGKFDTVRDLTVENPSIHGVGFYYNVFSLATRASKHAKKP